MSGERISDFLVQIETSSPPTPATPSTSTDVVTVGYGDTTYARQRDLYFSQTTVQGIRDIGVSSRFDRQMLLLDGGTIYWFDASATGTDDGDTILTPTSGSGRWLKLASSSGGGGGIKVESMEHLAAQRHAQVPVTDFDNSLLEAFDGTGNTFEGFLLDNYSSGTTIYLAVNPKFFETSNKNSDFVTYTGVTGTSTANLDTETTTKKIGASANSWDKTSGTVNSFIQRDLGSGNGISLSGHRKVMCFVNLPSATDVSKISIRMSDGAADPTNFGQYDATTQDVSTGSAAFAAGWNLVSWDIDRTADSSGGTGWAVASNLLRTFAIGIVTGSTSTTKTNIVFDSLVFIQDSGANTPDYLQLLRPGHELTIADNSARSKFIVSSASTAVIGAVTLTGSIGTSYTGGTSSVIMRSVLGFSGDNRSHFQTTSPLLGATLNSGASNLTQDVRVSKVLNLTLASSTIESTIGYDTEFQFEVIDTPTGTTTTVVAPADLHLDLLSGAVLHIITFFDGPGGVRSYSYTPGNDMTLTANSSWSGGVLTLTASSGDTTSVDTAIAAGHGAILVKANQIAGYLSLVGATANESMSAMSLSALQIKDLGLQYPKSTALFGHYFKLTPSQSTATFAGTNRRGTFGSLTVVGTGAASFAQTFKNGQLGAGVFSDSNYFRTGSPSTDDPGLNPDSGAGVSAVSFSFWLYALATPSAANFVLDRRSNAGTAGWHVQYHTDRTVKLAYDGSAVATSAVLTLGTWNHIVGVMQDNTLGSLYVNGVKTSVSSTAISNQANNALWIGRSVTGTGNSCDSCYLADLILWSGTSGILTDSDVGALYAAGRHRVLGSKAGFFNHYVNSGVSGQKLSMLAEVARTTSATEPFITHMGCVKTS